VSENVHNDEDGPSECMVMSMSMSVWLFWWCYRCRSGSKGQSCTAPCQTSVCAEVTSRIVSVYYSSLIFPLLLSNEYAAGLIRYLIVCLDSSVCAKETDYRPNRLESTKAAIERFMREYFDQNPISQVSLFMMINRDIFVILLRRCLCHMWLFINRCQWHWRGIG
jgi:hypothetical protein